MATLFHLFPATIHPMVVHFTIATIFLAGLAGVMSLFYRRDHFVLISFLIMLILSFLAVAAAGAAGVISESYLPHIPQSVQGMLHQHKQYGEITGVFVTVALIMQAWRLLRRKAHTRPSYVAVISILIAVVLVSITGHLGGTMVYSHGLGVH